MTNGRNGVGQRIADRPQPPIDRSSSPRHRGCHGSGDDAARSCQCGGGTSPCRGLPAVPRRPGCHIERTHETVDHAVRAARPRTGGTRKRAREGRPHDLRAGHDRRGCRRWRGGLHPRRGHGVFHARHRQLHADGVASRPRPLVGPPGGVVLGTLARPRPGDGAGRFLPAVRLQSSSHCERPADRCGACRPAPARPGHEPVAGRSRRGTAGASRCACRTR